MVIGTTFIKDLTFVDTLFVIILGWTLVVLWERFINNFTFNTLQLNKDSTYHTFIIATVATVAFLVFVFTFDELLGNIVESDISSGFQPPAPLNPVTPTSFETLEIVPLNSRLTKEKRNFESRSSLRF